ncbi:MAG: SpoIIE family protein phosphatase [Nitriliruptorales bacterium]|nr:SpoIIE family protein phosphatase [Nitriliruptorales bacterium]
MSSGDRGGAGSGAGEGMGGLQRRDVQELLKRMPGLETLLHAVVITDTDGVVTFWNDAAARLLGWSPEEAVGARLVDLILLEPTPDEVVQRLQSDPEWSGEMALRKRAGMAFLARVHQVPLADELGAVNGILRLVTDITDVTWARRQVLEQGERARRALAAAHVGAWHLDITTGLATWDETMEALFGLERGSFPGSRRSWLDLIHPEDRGWVIEEVRKAVASGSRTLDIEHRIVHAAPDDTWVQCVGRTFTTGGEVTSISGVAYDITERRHADEERAAFLRSERARRDRFTLLAEASAAFAESLDDEDVMAAVGKLAVPRLADWFAIDLADPAGIRTVATAHSDPSRRELVGYLGRRFGNGAGAVPDVVEVIRDGHPRLFERLDVTAWPRVARNPEHRALLAALGLHSLMIVPLTASGRTFGAMTFAIGDSNLSYSTEDLDLAGDLARRAALSIDNARLFADRTHVARVLQRSLLPPQLPDVPGVNIAARYRAAVADSDIGGDFYDVFQTGDDRWSVVLGDVSGKGTDAAVLTGLARHTLRAAAMRASGPVEVLSSLNHAILAPEYGERFVTLAYVQMVVRDDGAELVVSSAGHPNPMIVRSDGTVVAMKAVGAILGLFDDVHIEHEVVELHPGDLLVLYTDGVLEARDRSGEFFGEGRLHDLLSGAPGRSPVEVVERIDTAVMAFQDGNPRDDIAILALGIDRDIAAALAQE